MKEAKSILILLLSGYLIFAMGGLSVFHHICNCNSSDNTTISIVANESCCAPNTNNSLQCDANSEDNSCSGLDCSDCGCKVQVAVLEIDYTTTNSDIAPNLLRLFQFAISSANIEEILTKSESTVPLPFISTNKFPPKAGKYLLILNQSLKIPLLVS
jgi:hypothetical protein